jgi:sugar O-acyltransferase (sialic acid O-acetyltransferase NeuD family)
MEDLIIVGAGGGSGDIAWTVEEINKTTWHWNLLGFLDDDPAKAGTLVHGGYPVLGAIDTVAAYPSAKLIVGVASYKNRCGRRSVVERLGLPPERFATIIAPSARASRHASVGRGSAVLQFAAIAPDAVIGNHVFVSHSCVIGHSARLFDFVTLAARATISGSAIVEEDVYVGAGSVVRDGVTVGAGALVGLGAAVFHNVASRTTVVGNPATSLRKRRSDRK